MIESKMQISEKAIKKLKSLNKSHIFLSLVDGGCAKYKYLFSLSQEEIAYHPFIFEEIEIRIPSHQLKELEQDKIDYKSDLVSAEFFVLENPYFDKNCGCGISVG